MSEDLWLKDHRVMLEKPKNDDLTKQNTLLKKNLKYAEKGEK